MRVTISTARAPGQSENEDFAGAVADAVVLLDGADQSGVDDGGCVHGAFSDPTAETVDDKTPERVPDCAHLAEARDKQLRECKGRVPRHGPSAVAEDTMRRLSASSNLTQGAVTHSSHARNP